MRWLADSSKPVTVALVATVQVLGSNDAITDLWIETADQIFYICIPFLSRPPRGLGYT